MYLCIFIWVVSMHIQNIHMYINTKVSLSGDYPIQKIVRLRSVAFNSSCFQFYYYLFWREVKLLKFVSIGVYWCAYHRSWTFEYLTVNSSFISCTHSLSGTADFLFHFLSIFFFNFHTIFTRIYKYMYIQSYVAIDLQLSRLWLL